MREYTHFPILNQKLAHDHIRAQGPFMEGMNYDSILVGWARHRDGTVKEHNLAYIAQDFTEKYPRGKGTMGHDINREFYMACYSVVAWRSHTPQYRRNMVRRLETKAQSFAANVLQAFMAFPEDGSYLENNNPDAHGSVFPATRWLMLLARDGFINGQWNAGGTPYRLFLTDAGMAVYKTVASRLRARKREDEIKIANDRAERAAHAIKTIAAMTAADDINEAIRLAQEAL